jgi:hypothetical protein
VLELEIACLTPLTCKRKASIASCVTIQPAVLQSLSTVISLAQHTRDSTGSTPGTEPYHSIIVLSLLLGLQSAY